MSPPISPVSALLPRTERERQKVKMARTRSVLTSHTRSQDLECSLQHKLMCQRFVFCSGAVISFTNDWERREGGGGAGPAWLSMTSRGGVAWLWMTSRGARAACCRSEFKFRLTDGGDISLRSWESEVTGKWRLTGAAGVWMSNWLRDGKLLRECDGPGKRLLIKEARLW